MLFCETGGSDPSDFDSLVVFASQARANGLPAVLSEHSIPNDLKASHQFDATPFLSSLLPTPDDEIIMLGAQKIDQSHANALRDLTAGAAISCKAYGVFETRQSEITVSSRLAYALNQNPEMMTPDVVSGFPEIDIPVFSATAPTTRNVKPTVGLFFPDLSSLDAVAALRQLNASDDFDVEIVTSGAEKKAWVNAHGYDVPVWHLGELLPRALSARFDVAVFHSKPIAWPRFQMLFANLVGKNAVLVDSTPQKSWRQIGEIIAGPVRLIDLSDWLKTSIIPNRDTIARDLHASKLVQTFQLPDCLSSSLPTPVKKKRKEGGDASSVLFIPTNGVGLGHAKRCSLVADAMRTKATSTFAAFPSCVDMLTASGFDTMPLVSRTAHLASHQNDLINYARLSAAAETSSATVFDGGYVFDSVMRAASDHNKPSVWIRRGLWQSSQNNQVAIDRQKTFTRIVVPTEAFDELNAPHETAKNVVQVGPIVQLSNQKPEQSRVLRKRVLESLGLKNKRLVVSMLGGGVAADRRAQINTICAHLEARSDVVHLLVVWPTATTDPGWFHYQNTRVVQSVHASALIPLADLFLSAVGYNSFHEVVYGQVPTIFIPQMAGFMDDQRARAKAAADREVALLIEPWEFLSLTQTIDTCLDGQAEVLRQNLRGLNLPQPGTKAAVQEILEVL